MIFDKTIQKPDVKVHKSTPPQPISKLHDVVNIRATNNGLTTRDTPFAATKPSIVPSNSASIIGFT